MFKVRSEMSRKIIIAVSTFVATAFLFVSVGAWATTIGTNIDSTGTLGAATSTPWGTMAVDQEEGKGRLKPIFVVGDNGSTTPFVFVSQKGVVAFGTSTPSPIFLNPGDVIIGRDGATNDLFVTGGLGLGNATTGDGHFVVGTDSIFTVFQPSGRIGMFGTTTPVIDGLSIGGAAGTHADVYVSGGLGVTNATTADGDFVVGSGPTFSVTGNGRAVLGASTTAATTGSGGIKLVVDGGDALISSGGTGTTTLSIVTEGTTAGGCIEMTGNAGITTAIFVNAAGTGLTVQPGSCR